MSENAQHAFRLRRYAEDDFLVIGLEGETCGRLRVAAGSEWNADPWTWAVTGMPLPAGAGWSGRAASLEAAKAMFAEAFGRWRARWGDEQYTDAIRLLAATRDAMDAYNASHGPKMAPP